MKYRTVEPIPTWALDYLINGETEGVNEEEIQAIDQWWKEWKVDTIYPLTDKEGNAQPYFSNNPMWGLPTEVEDSLQSKAPRR